MDADFEEIENYLNQFGEGTITLEKDHYASGIAILQFSNPKKRNAISGKMMVAFRHCVLELEQWQAGKAVLLYGTHGNFCSGGDLDFARASGTPREALFMSRWMRDALSRLRALPLLSVCLLQGPSLGGGAEVAAACDCALAAPDARFGFVHARMRIVTAWGGGTRLVARVGRARALELLLTARVLDAGECVALGLADCVLDAGEDCLAQAIRWIEARCAHGAHIVRCFKRIVHNAQEADAFEAETELFATTWGSEANREALASNIRHVNVDKE